MLEMFTLYIEIIENIIIVGSESKVLLHTGSRKKQLKIKYKPPVL